VPDSDADTEPLPLTVLLTLGSGVSELLTVAVRVALPLILGDIVTVELLVWLGVHDTVTVTDAVAVLEGVRLGDLVLEGVNDGDGVLDGVAVMVPVGVGTQVPLLGTSSSHVGL